MDIRNFLSKQKQQFDINENYPDAILLVMNAGIIEWANSVACEMFEMNSHNFSDITIDDILEKGFELVKNAELDKKAFIAKSTIKESYYELTAKRIEWGYVVALRDSTRNYKRISDILAEKENTSHITRDKNEFLIKLSNKFNPSLQSIIGFSQGLIDGLGGETTDKQNKYLNIIRNNSLELSYFFNKLIELSQSEAEMFDSDIKYFDFVNIVEQTIKSLQDNYEEKSLNINLIVNKDFKRRIYQDEILVKIILQNLIETVFREMEIGTVSISVADATEDFLNSRNISNVPSVIFSISSLNMQITDNELQFLFNPYAIIDTLSRANITRALALGTAKNVAKSIGGVAWVENVPMQGPVFNVVIPKEHQ